MSRFVQIHLLTSYPPANLNRDDLGRPKTAVMGGSPRLRISSQSLKRAWRTSEIFKEALDGHIGTRTKALGSEYSKKLLDLGVPEKKAREWARAIAAQFGKLKKAKDDGKPEALEIEQLAHISPEEQAAIDNLLQDMAKRKEGPTADELKILKERHTAADIALFGRMLASSPIYNTEAAAQVAHAITVHKVAVEDDFFTAVDDLNIGDEDLGAGHMGVTEFASGLFYLYACIDRNLLLENLSNDIELAKKTMAALIECAAKVAPTGKQNSFGSRARASYILCERGDQQPRTLSIAFLNPITGDDMLPLSIKRLKSTQSNMDKVYGDCADVRCEMNASSGEGALQAIIDCATEDWK